MSVSFDCHFLGARFFLIADSSGALAVALDRQLMGSASRVLLTNSSPKLEKGGCCLLSEIVDEIFRYFPQR